MSEALRLLSSVIQPKGDPPGAHPKSEFINTKSAAQWLGIPERSMQQYVQMGLLPSYKLGKHRLFRKNELLEALGGDSQGYSCRDSEVNSEIPVR